MIDRIYNLSNELDGSIFLFGARQTGKSTILRQQFPESIYIDLLDSQVKSRYERRRIMCRSTPSIVPSTALKPSMCMTFSECFGKGRCEV